MKYNSSIITLILLVILFNTSCHTPTTPLLSAGKTIWADSTLSVARLSTDATGKRILSRDNTLFDYISFIDREKTIDLLVKVTKSETTRMDSPTTFGTFNIQVTDIANNHSWSKKLEGSDIDYSQKVLTLHTEPKDGQHEDTYTMYSILTGVQLMNYTYSPTKVLIPNTSQKRFFGYLSGMSAVEEKPTGLATVTYTGSDGVIDRVSIHLKGNTKLPTFTPELKMLTAKESSNSVADEGKTTILAQANRTFSAADIGGFAFQINYYMADGAEPLRILLPVRDDHVDLKNADYDARVFELTIMDK